MIIGSTSTVNKFTEKKLHLPISLLQSPLTNENCSGCKVWNIVLPRHIILGHHQSSASSFIALLLGYLESWWALDTSFGIYKQNTCFQRKKKIMPSDSFWDLSRTCLLFALANSECFPQCVWKWLIDDILVCYCWNCFYMETWYLG